MDAYSCGVDVPKIPESPAYTRWLLSTDLTKLEADSSHVCRVNSNPLSQVVSQPAARSEEVVKQLLASSDNVARTV